MTGEALGAIVGSASDDGIVRSLGLRLRMVATPWGDQELYEGVSPEGRELLLIHRHGLPHRRLPNQVNYRAQAWALKARGCGALLVSSSVGVLDPEIPLYRPLLVTDLLMPENRLPDGSTCTMFVEPSEDQGHLVLTGGLFSRALGRQLRGLDSRETIAPEAPCVFVYAGGPRSKTPAENRMWARLGAQVNSMSVGPEVVLANELEMACAALVVGHKYSVPGMATPSTPDLEQTLVEARRAGQHLVERFLEAGRPVPFGNQIYRF
jgi:5'-methylthioadenosine phosphorylase